MLAFLSLLNLIYSICLAVFPQPRKTFATKYLKAGDIYSDQDNDLFIQKLIKRFINNYLKQDGVFLLKIISSNTNTVMVTDIVRYLWEIFRKRQFHIESNGSLHTVHHHGEPSKERNSRFHPPTGRVIHLPNDDEEDMVPLRTFPSESFV